MEFFNRYHNRLNARLNYIDLDYDILSMDFLKIIKILLYKFYSSLIY